MMRSEYRALSDVHFRWDGSWDSRYHFSYGHGAIFKGVKGSAEACLTNKNGDQLRNCGTVNFRLMRRLNTIESCQPIEKTAEINNRAAEKNSIFSG